MGLGLPHIFGRYTIEPNDTVEYTFKFLVLLSLPEQTDLYKNKQEVSEREHWKPTVVIPTRCDPSWREQSRNTIHILCRLSFCGRICLFWIKCLYIQLTKPFLYYLVTVLEKKYCEIFLKISLRKASDQTLVVVSSSDTWGSGGPGIPFHRAQLETFSHVIGKLFI